MSILSAPLIADIVARLVSAAIIVGPGDEVAFTEIEGRTTEVSIPTRHGFTPAVIYHPEPQATTPGVYVNLHGGGFVIGHPEQDDPWCRYLAAHANVVVLNVDYVLAPGSRFPAAAEQIYDVLRWASAPKRDWDGSRLCVGGQSAGGNLSTAAARLALENGGPAIALQVLHYPPLDIATPTNKKSSPAGAKAVLRPWMGDVFDAAYVPKAEDRRHRLVSPAWGTNSDDIAGIAPAVVITAELDRLRAEAITYAEKLDAAGSLVKLYDLPGVDHGYNIMSDDVELTREMYDAIAGHVRDATAVR
jgi:acetyl esterase